MADNPQTTAEMLRDAIKLMREGGAECGEPDVSFAIGPQNQERLGKIADKLKAQRDAL